MTQQIEEKLRYKRTFILSSFAIAASATLSELFDCGGCQARGLLFPENWTACNIQIYPSPIPEPSSYLITNVDGTSFSIPTIANQWLPMLPYISDSLPYFQISCSVAQTDAVVVGVALQPIYQGIHG